MTAAVARDGDTPCAIVTGAAGGIGQATSRALHTAGYRILLTDLDPAVRALAGELGAGALECDLAEPASPAALVARALELFGRLDALVCVAGLQCRADAAGIDETSWQRLLDVNVSATYRLVRAAIPSLVCTRGSIVAVSSMAADRAVSGIVPYGATKAALAHLCRGLAVELGPLGVRVNMVAPGYIETPMTAGLLADEPLRKRKLERIPLGWLGSGDEVADPVLFLLSPAARYVTGASLPVDGGYAVT